MQTVRAMTTELRGIIVQNSFPVTKVESESPLALDIPFFT
jgi:hypothetical protein